MKKFFARGVVAMVFSGLAGTVPAALIKWDTDSGSSSTTTSCTSGVGNGCTFTKSGEVLKARAYATNNDSGSGDFKKATISVYDGGLGVRHPDQSEARSSPHHTTEKTGKYHVEAVADHR